MNERDEEEDEGRRLLSVVERLIADDATLIAFARECAAKHPADLDAAAGEAIAHYAWSAALSGGATALPGIVPGLGSLLAVTGGTLVDMGLLLKFEVELSLVLSTLHGFDIAREEERQLAFLLASVGTYDARTGWSYLGDVARAEVVAIWNYAPRELSKMLVTVMAKLALVLISRSFVRALPLVGIGVGASMNKVLTERVGERCKNELRRRKPTVRVVRPEDDVVDAKVRK
ncbi:EcsC family protein [bacterium]|nr:EcsC family protein [bacterium]